MDRQKQIAVVQTIILLAIALAADTITGGIAIASSPLSISGCNNPSSLEQCGTTKVCTITAPATTCSVTITFPTAFGSVPLFESAQWAGFNVASNHPEKNVPAFSTTFEADNGQTWTNMPAATTELYGTTNHETSLDSGFVLSLASSAQFYASCLTPPTSANSILRPQFWNIGAGAWQELAGVAGGLDIPLGGSFCTPGGGGNSNLESGFSTIAPAAQSQQTELRVVGFNGAGVGDSPTLNNIFLVFFTVIKQTPAICIPGIVTGQVCPGLAAPANLKTQMAFLATIEYPPVSGFEVDVNWIAKE